MKPAPFDLAFPTTVAEAVQLLSQHGDSAKMLAGGQSLMPVLNMRLARPSVVIDLNGLRELDYIRQEGDQLRIGAMTRQHTVATSPLVAEKLPVLAEVIGYIGHTTIRNRGTIGGSLAHADPSAELGVAAVTLDAEFVVTGAAGTRTIAAQDFFLGYFTTALQSSEILTEVRLPILARGTVYAFEELARRHGDFAIASVLATLRLDSRGRCAEAHLGVAGANPAPVRVRAAEALLNGELLTDRAIAAAALAVSQAVEPDSDMHASEEYRRDMAQVLTRRALQKAAERAEGGAA